MKKRKRFIILLILIAVLIFSISATCNFCGMSVSTEEDETEENERSTGEESEDGGETTTADEDADTTGEEENREDEGESEEEGIENQPPEIVSIFYGDDDMIDFLEDESIPARFERATHEFIIIAEDPEGDEMDFEIDQNHGEITDKTRVANDSVAFTWISPDNTEDSETPLMANINLTVSDSSGNEDSFTINIALLPVAEEVLSISASIEADESLSGFVMSDGTIRTGVIVIGDWETNAVSKGYLSFNISDSMGIDISELNMVKLRFDNINVSSNPEDFASAVDFKKFNYGSELDIEDFEVGGRRFFTTPISEFMHSFEASSDILKEEFINSVRAEEEWFQIKFALNSTTDNDDTGDYFQMHPPTVFLDVEYELYEGE